MNIWFNIIIFFNNSAFFQYIFHLLVKFFFEIKIFSNFSFKCTTIIKITNTTNSKVYF